MTNETAWQTDNSGMLRGVRYHDGVLESLDYIAGDHIRIRIRATSGELLFVEVAGLADMFVELWAGNIISDIFVWPVAAVPLVALGFSDGPWNTLLRGRVKSEKDASEAARDLARRFPDYHFVHVLCSYGGVLAAVGQSVTIKAQD
jgi:hypothetical protein